MARRGRRRRRNQLPQVPVQPDGLDSPEVQAEINANRQQKTLSGFNSVIRYIKSAELGSVDALKNLCEQQLEAIGEEPGGRRVRGLPQGSNHIDLQAVVLWLKKVGKDDTDAVNQLKAIHATASNRLKG